MRRGNQASRPVRLITSGRSGLGRTDRLLYHLDGMATKPAYNERGLIILPQ